jgi:hypothetical protein
MDWIHVTVDREHRRTFLNLEVNRHLLGTVSNIFI